MGSGAPVQCTKAKKKFPGGLVLFANKASGIHFNIHTRMSSWMKIDCKGGPHKKGVVFPLYKSVTDPYSLLDLINPMKKHIQKTPIVGSSKIHTRTPRHLTLLNSFSSFYI